MPLEPNPYLAPEAIVSNPEVPVAELTYGGFWRRLGAYLLDIVVLLPLAGLSIWLGNVTRLYFLYDFVPFLFIGLFFNVYLVQKYGGTPGKLISGLRIVRTDGTPVGIKESSIRYSVLFVLTTLQSIAFILATLKMSDAEYHSLNLAARNIRIAELAPTWYRGIAVLINVWTWSEFLVLLTNKKRRSLHDFMAGTVVVRAA